MTRAWIRELTGWVLAAAVALITAATVASTARAELLFRDADSLIVALLSRSLLAGASSDWAMSSVLFLPETAVFTTLDATLPIGVEALFAVSAVVNVLALYGTIRLAAGRRREGFAPVSWSVIAVSVFGMIAMTETSASRDALELASLQLTTTYYSATVVAAVLSIGIARRMLDGSARHVALPLWLGVVAALSTLTNPLYAAWAAAPLVLFLSLGALRPDGRRRRLALLAALVTGTALGFALRIPLSAWIANTGAGYAQPALWRESAGYYGALLLERLRTPPGAIALVVVLVLLVLAAVRAMRASDDPGARLVAVAAWAIPVLVTVGAIALGTHAARYLQPVVFAPVLALVAVPRGVALPTRAGRTAATAAVVVVVCAAGATGIPRLSAAVARPDADLTCVTDWIDSSDRGGAGQFWAARLPKLLLDDPSQLVQVDNRLNGYAWLVDRSDFAAGTVTFLVEDPQSVAWVLPRPAIPDRIVRCGRWSILDFASTPLPLGPARS